MKSSVLHIKIYLYHAFFGKAVEALTTVKLFYHIMLAKAKPCPCEERSAHLWPESFLGPFIPASYGQTCSGKDVTVRWIKVRYFQEGTEISKEHGRQDTWGMNSGREGRSWVWWLSLKTLHQGGWGQRMALKPRMCCEVEIETERERIRGNSKNCTRA